MNPRFKSLGVLTAVMVVMGSSMMGTTFAAAWVPHYDYGFEDLTYHDVGTLGMAPASPIELTFLGQGRGDSIVTVTAGSSPSDPSATGVTINDTLNWPDSEVQQFAGDWTLRFTTDSDRAFADSYNVWFDITGVEPTYFAFDVLVFQETGGPTAMATVTVVGEAATASGDFLGHPSPTEHLQARAPPL